LCTIAVAACAIERSPSASWPRLPVWQVGVLCFMAQAERFGAVQTGLLDMRGEDEASDMEPPDALEKPAARKKGGNLNKTK
jgi:hypothetical protein